MTISSGSVVISSDIASVSVTMGKVVSSLSVSASLVFGVGTASVLPKINVSAVPSFSFGESIQYTRKQ